MTTTTPIKRTYTNAFESMRLLGEALRPEGLSWLTELKGAQAQADIVLHISCNAHYTLFIPYIAQEILKKIDKSFVVFGGPESCCGSIQFNMGDPDLEEMNARLALMMFNRVKPQLLVSVCPDCDEVFDKFRPAPVRFDITNISDLFVKYLDELRPLLKPVNKRVVIHHHASGPQRIEDAQNMRTLLQAIPGIEIVDAQHALGPGIHCQTVKPMPEADQKAMVEEAVLLDVDSLVVPYHSCYRQHIAMELTHTVKVEHYLGLLAQSLGIAYDEPYKRLRLTDDVDVVMNALRPAVEKLGFDMETVTPWIRRVIFLGKK
ncbi:heterodisulfide reductase-related iron-sulfur binding cluster [Hydrogenophaga sp.]|uniref:heterodisulfide reductase-related iron-sulfur binding cluster n=1 Tax=Hydrogenophaga sp. TaxID=1904254 RepID=UPI00271C56D2|nr:heterodisulfide reductase-related iron-sulfur binding cluster [Hydrogenophaga sp.]MDO9437906.1 heterodisulfide reductase-related iron-sulfur binding cluster [Hydrogenophaga sp.]